MHGKKLLYVTACGRSGTTLLGFVLGNIQGAIDLGEVNEYVRFRGRPNGFEPGTTNYEFWDRVLIRLRSKIGEPDFEGLEHLHRAVDYHLAMLAQVLTGGGYRGKSVVQQRAFLTALYQSIFDESPHSVIVDSSKYPSRLWHLSQIIPAESLYVIHLKRNAMDVIRAMRTSGQGEPKSFVQAVAYYHGIEFLISKICRKFDAAKTFDLAYEDLVSNPESELERLGRQFQLEVTPAIDKIRENLPLERGFIFNGNRMRMQEQVVFRKKQATSSS